MGVIKLSVQLILLTIIAALILLCVPGLPPHVKFESYTVTPPAKLEGKLAINDKLDKAELVFNDEFVGPESIAIRGDEVYTGIIGGYIIRIKDGKWENVVQTGSKCDGPWEVEICGRPLGLRFEPSGKLLVADAGKGILRVDVDKKTVETIVPRHGKIEGTKNTLNFADDIDVSTKDNKIYFSDAGQVGTFGDTVLDIIGEPTGMLLQYDPKTKKTTVLLDGLRFANGVQLSKNEDFLVVTETGLGRVLKYHLKGPKQGKADVIVDGLPGYPDNIRSNGKGGFYVANIVTRLQEDTGLDKLGPLPWARKMLLRFQLLAVNLLKLLYSYTPNDFIGNAIVYVKHLGPIGDAHSFPKKTIIVEIDENGKILGSLQTDNGKVTGISEIGLGEKYTYLGSPFTAQLWRIKTEYIS